MDWARPWCLMLQAMDGWMCSSETRRAGDPSVLLFLGGENTSLALERGVKKGEGRKTKLSSFLRQKKKR